jgi:hypothetical protein
VSKYLATDVVQQTNEASVAWINSSGLADASVRQHVDSVAREVANWVSTTQGRGRSTLFDRQAYLTPDNPYSQMKLAGQAVDNDDVVGGVCDVTEGLMLQGIKWEDESADVADVFNQMNRDLNLDEFCRMWHREEFKYSQVVIGIWWGRKSYTVRGRTMVEDPKEQIADPTSPTGAKPKKKPGAKRRKTYELTVPVALTFLDPMKVVPLSPGPFGQDRLAWQATRQEVDAWTAGDAAYMDPVMASFLTGPAPVDLSLSEKEVLTSYGVVPEHLIELNPDTVFRYCRTKMSYQRFPDNRLRSIFPLLDLKQQLLEADRVTLVGAANYILLVKKGTKEDPAEQEEIDNLKENMKVVAKLPVIVGDHRLNIEIITPNQDYTLASEKYDVLDRRIMSRCLGALTIASNGQRNESTLTVARGVARTLETRRHMMKRMLEDRIARAVVEHPENKGVLDAEPNLAFTPRNVQLDSDAQIVQAIMALRTQKELSRESTLEYFGFDQATEAQRRESEADFYDPIFQTQVPFNGANGDPNQPGQPGQPGQPDNQGPNGGGEASQVSGARGGRPTGGGTSKKSPQRAIKKTTPSGNPATGKDS